ncbi:MAG: glycosyltransferase [Bacteroidota bacterium]
MKQPLVSVICLCYNHERFVREALTSVIDQTYEHVEIIVVDDASTDASVEIIKDVIAQNRITHFVPLAENLGNCAAFNRGLKLATGEYIIDFATDDVMAEDRLSKQVTYFEQLADDFGVLFTDALYINEEGEPLIHHNERLRKHGLLDQVPEGNLYTEVLSRYFISSPTMMIKKEVFDALGGYDEQLVYEDFDLWVRAARDWQFAFLDEPLTKVRKLSQSMSTTWYVPGDKQLHSTYLVCKKAQALNRSEEDKEALIIRVKYEMRQAVFSGNHREAKLFWGLLTELGGRNGAYTFLDILNRLKLPLIPLRRTYHALRFGR